MGDFDGLYGTFDADPRVRGRQFEHVCKWFLENDPVYRSELRRVWLWDDWPGRWGGDAGIDLVAEDRNGELWAIQAKAYDPKYRVSKKDVDKFLSESGRKTFAYRMLVATTDLIDRTGERTIQQQEKRSSFFRLNDLRAAAVDWPSSPQALRPAKPRKPARPRKHQTEAIRDVVKGFTASDRGQLIMACGTGKTLAALFITEKLESKRTLVLVPSLSLLKQTLNEWRANCTTEFASMPVCSDDTVGNDDAAVSHTSDLNVPAETDPEKIAAFLRRKSGPLVVFSTYQSSPQIAEAFRLGRVPGFDFIIADEAHRCAGPVSSDFATVLDPQAIRGTRRLFMTATPRYFTGRVIKAAKDADYEIASMDDEKKFGPVFHRLPFGEAIERDLLTDYQVAVVGVDDATYREWAQKGTLVTRDGKEILSAATLAGQIGLAKAMRKYDLRRTISFHSRVARAQDFAACMPDVLAWMPSRQRPKGALWSRHASGAMPAGDRYVLLQHLARLDDSERGLLANARCLAEGVDVPTLDGVAFIDPRRSEVDIVQAVGRAIRKSEAKTVGTIVIPVFIDTDEDPEVALDSSAFKPVWDVIKALRAHDEELGEQLDSYRRRLGKQGGLPPRPGKIHFDLPARVGTEFARAFNVRLVERTTATWEFWFGLLEQVVKRNGHARFPSSFTIGGQQLGSWVNTQRVSHGKGTLDADRERRLQDVPGWTWDPFADQWEEGFGRLQDYVLRHGDASAPRSYTVDGYQLGVWVKSQRRNYAESTLAADRQRRLRELPGWTWDPYADQWNEGFNLLLDYVERQGDARVPASYTVDGYRLGRWVIKQRVAHSEENLEAERKRRLQKLPGWTWDTNAARWEEGFSRLQDYVKHHGDARVPTSYTVDGYKLGNWVKTCRILFNKGALPADRKRRLKKLPAWTWDPKAAQWEEGFSRLQDYVKRHGDARVPKAYTVDGYKLGEWVSGQRSKWKTLDADRQGRLQKLPGWTRDSYADQWEEGFGRLQDYVERHGDPRVPTSYTVDRYKLGQWVNNQRSKWKTLDSDRQRRLQNLPGWTLDTKAAQWEEGFRRLQDYVEGHGNALVPKSYTVDGYPLGEWVGTQRAYHKRGKLEPDRERRLKELPGWVWDTRASQWEERFRLLMSYVKSHGDAFVPYSYSVDGYPLGVWVGTQRAYHNGGKLEPDRERRLRELPGWVWDASALRGVSR